MVSINIGIVTVWADSGAGFVSQSYYNILKKHFNVEIYCRGSYIQDNNLEVWQEGNVTVDTSNDHATNIDKKKFINWIKQKKIQIILFNEQRYWQPVLWAKEFGVKCISYIDYYTAETIDFFHIYDGLLCNTKRHFDIFKHISNTIYIPWGTSPKIYFPKKNIKIIDDCVYFLHSAGLGGPNDRKGTKNVILSFKNTKGNAILYIDSQLPLTYFDDEIQNVVKNESRIVFRHITTTPPHNYKDADVYVYPTRLEGIGLTISEALMSGLPVITTDNPPMNEIVIDNFNGKLVEVTNYIARYDGYYWPEAIINLNSLTNLLQFYIDNPEIISQHSANARNKSLNELNWDNNCLNLGDYILKTISNPNTIIPQHLIKKIKNYDRKYNSTSFDVIKLGVKMLLKNIFKLK